MGLGAAHPMDLMGQEQRLLARIKQLEDRIAALERGIPLPVTGSVPAPSSGAENRAVVRSAGGAATTPGLLVKINGSWFESPFAAPR